MKQVLKSIKNDKISSPYFSILVVPNPMIYLSSKIFLICESMAVFLVTTSDFARGSLLTSALISLIIKHHSLPLR